MIRLLFQLLTQLLVRLLNPLQVRRTNYSQHDKRDILIGNLLEQGEAIFHALLIVKRGQTQCMPAIRQTHASLRIYLLYRQLQVTHYSLTSITESTTQAVYHGNPYRC